MALFSLYIKTHKVTGLKYFGVTTKRDVFKYKGSGIYWVKHLKKHGYNVCTEIYYTSDNQQDINKKAVEFSLNNNIVLSRGWANLVIEDGGTGTALASEATKNKMSAARGGKGNTLKLTEVEVLAIRADTLSSIKELSLKYGVSRGAISKILRGVNWKHLLPDNFTPISKKATRVTLDYEKALAIRELVGRGNKGSTVAKIFGITKSTVSKIILNQIWKKSR